MTIENKAPTVFRRGKTDYRFAAETAAGCSVFREDYEEEWTADEEKSCYNCRYRRWTADGFMCMKGETL